MLANVLVLESHVQQVFKNLIDKYLFSASWLFC